MTGTAARKPFSPRQIVVICHDAPDSQAMRRAATPAHLRYIETIIDRLALAGPLYSDDGRHMTGSLYFFKTESLAEARGLLEADPYFAARLWSSIEYRPFLPAAGEVVGGTTW